MGFLFLLSSVALSAPTLGPCACQAVMVCTGGGGGIWDEGIVGQTVVAYQKNLSSACAAFSYM